jgi:hypothetical protein
MRLRRLYRRALRAIETHKYAVAIVIALSSAAATLILTSEEARSTIASLYDHVASAMADATKPKPTGACLIKGNINEAGECIYHVPGSYWYDRTSISPAHGERYFCTVEEAIAAGCRAPRMRRYY